MLRQIDRDATVAKVAGTDIMEPADPRRVGGRMSSPRTQLTIEELASDSTSGSTLRINGELDISTADALRRAVAPYVAAGGKLVLDLSRVTFCDSTGLAVLVGIHKRLAAGGGGLELYAPVQRVQHLLTITGLNRVFPVRAAEPGPGAEPA
jgi:anti-anti-sigma factor